MLTVRARDGAVAVGAWTGDGADVLTTADHARILDMAAPEARAQRAAAYVLRRAEFITRTGDAPCAFPAPGMPVRGLHWSLSHTCGAVAVATDLRPVGIDIECVCRRGDPVRRAARFFATAEAERLAALEPGAAALSFAWRWTAKEALLKALGLKLGAALKLDMGPEESLPFRRALHGALVHVVTPAAGYVLSLAQVQDRR